MASGVGYSFFADGFNVCKQTFVELKDGDIMEAALVTWQACGTLWGGTSFSGAPYIVWDASIYQDVCPCHFFGPMNFYQNPFNFF